MNATKAKYPARLTAYLSDEMDNALEAARHDLRLQHKLKTDKSMFVRAALQLAMDELAREGQQSRFYRCLSELESA